MKTVLTSGWARNQPGTSALRTAQWDRSGSGTTRVVVEYGQPPSDSETPYQPFARARYATAPRQFSACESPTSAIVARALFSSAPKAHGLSAPTFARTVHGAFGM